MNKPAECIDCGEGIEQAPGRGRPRLRCEACRAVTAYGGTRACYLCGGVLPGGSRVSRCDDCAPASRAPKREQVSATCRCGATFSQRTALHRYCSPACRPSGWTSRPGARTTTAARGYGSEHRAARAAALAQLARDGEGVCCIGGEPIYPGQRLHLDHTPDRQGYRGLACEHHNRQDGARRGRARQGASPLRW